jgi:perosamine synthetase
MSASDRTAALAIDGGAPVRQKMLPYARQVVNDRDIEAVTEALRSSWLTTGPRVAEFEAALTAATGAAHAVAFSSGTAALHGATAVAGLGAGDEALTTPLTFVATANAAVYVGATPTFADVDPASLLLDPDAVAEAVTARTKALVPVDYGGQPADYARLREIADRAPGGRLTIIADASHSLGATRDGRSVGTLADMTVLSLHPAKIITTAEGGAVLTERHDLAEGLRRFRNHGIATELQARRDWRYDMVALGFNYRLSDVMCALGLAQLERLEAFVATRRRLAARYSEALVGHWAVEIQEIESGADPAWHLFVLQLRLDRLRVDRGQVYQAMRAEGIGVNVHYIPVHHHSWYREHLPQPAGSLPNADAAYERLLTLPLHAGMTDSDVDDVIAALNKVTTAYRAQGVPS